MSAASPRGGERRAVACNLCGGEKAAVCFQEECLGEVFTIVRCASCGLRYVSPRPVLPPPPGPDDPEGEDFLARSKRVAYYRRAIAVLKSLAPGPRLLDVGCGTGVFLELAAKGGGFEAEGLEPGRSAAALARGKGLKVREADLAEADLPAAAFDAVTLWDVLEHLPDPRAALLAAARLLRSGGICLVKVPNANALTARAARFLHRLQGKRAIRRAHGLQHLYHFSPRTLKALVRSAGLEVIFATTEESAFSGFSASRARRAAKAALGGIFRLLPLGLDEEIVVVARRAARG